MFLFLGVVPSRGSVYADLAHSPFRELILGSETGWGRVFGIRSLSRLTLWVQMDAVKRLFRVAQTRIGAKQRIPTKERVEIFRFVNRNLPEFSDQSAPSWERLHRDWLSCHPDYEPDWRYFRREYNSARGDTFSNGQDT